MKSIDLSATRSWQDVSNFICANFEAPQTYEKYKLIDVSTEQWLSLPYTLAELESDYILLIHEDDAKNYGSLGMTVQVADRVG